MLLPYRHCPKREGGVVKACQDVLCTLFPTFARGCIGLARMAWGIFFHDRAFDRGGGVKSYLGNVHIEPTHFKKGLPLPNQKYELVHQVLGGTRIRSYSFLSLSITHLLQSNVIET